jgi:hypothetical protein
LGDVYGLAEWKYGDQITFTGFKEKTTGQVLDFVFVGPRNGSAWEVKGYSVLANRFDDGVWSSDHRAVVADLVLRG